MTKRNRSIKGPQWPKPEAPFLADIVAALRKRSKAIKHQFGFYSCETNWDQDDDERFEKVELYFESLRDRPYRITCHLWDDRWLWIDVRQATARRPVEAGWAFEWSHSGRVGETSPQDIIRAIEISKSATFRDDPALTKSILNDVWVPIACNGPIGSV